MNVLYTCNNNYVWLMGISMISLFKNNISIKELTVYLLGEDISDENKNIILGIAEEYHRSVFIIDVPKIDIPQSLVSVRWPLSAYTRLYSGELLPSYVERVLYLDCDTIVKGNISELQTINISGKIVYGVKDCISKNYKKNIGLAKDDIYVNAGVLLFNLNELRKINIKAAIDKYMNIYEKRINYADQDVLNGMLRGQIGILSPKYDIMTIDVVHNYKEIMALRRPTNFYTEKELNIGKEEAIVIHFTTNMRVIRPWFSNSDHPLKSEFLKYKALSPWKEKKLPDMVFTSNEAKVISVINILPCKVSSFILGMIHSTLKPIYIRLRRN